MSRHKSPIASLVAQGGLQKEFLQGKPSRPGPPSALCHYYPPHTLFFISASSSVPASCSVLLSLCLFQWTPCWVFTCLKTSLVTYKAGDFTCSVHCWIPRACGGT